MESKTIVPQEPALRKLVLLTMCHLNTRYTGGVTRDRDQAEGQIAYSNYKGMLTPVFGIWESHLITSRHFLFNLLLIM